MTSHSSENSGASCNLQNRDFKIILEGKGSNQQQLSIHLVAPTIQEKAAWISDISQVTHIYQTI